VIDRLHPIIVLYLREKHQQVAQESPVKMSLKPLT